MSTPTRPSRLVQTWFTTLSRQRSRLVPSRFTACYPSSSRTDRDNLSRSFDIDPAIFELLHAMVKTAQAAKAWRSTVSDAFADNRFFNAAPASNAQWKPLVSALMTSDKERLPDLIGKLYSFSDHECTAEARFASIGKISTASSANIFTNRELESLSRALSLRRLTYTLYTCERDRFLTQLPVIQEKLVDLLRSSVGDMVHAEVSLFSS